MDLGQGTIGDGAQTISAGAYARIARDHTGKLPAGADGRALLGFATLSHSNLKSWAKLDAAQGHNTRTKNTPNARKDAPLPIELLAERSGPYIGRVKGILREHDVPVKIRKGGTIACEDVYGASPEYWNRNGDWKLKRVDEIRNDPAVQAALALARRKHGPRLVSCSLHLDEESPHVHVLSVPLVKRAHSKRGRKPAGTPRDENGKPLIDSRPKVTKWSLDVSSIRGLSSQLEKNHDEWAEVCKPFRLVRGARGSEMTEEQRRARRNRQTGRSSHAEKEAREERERLHEEAERSRDRGADYEKEAKEKAELTEADRLAAKEAREAAEAAFARVLSQEVEIARIQRELAEKQDDLAALEKTLKQRAAALEHETSVHDDQMRLIARALDPASPVRLHHGKNGLEAAGLDYRDRNASRGRWDWLPGGLEAFATRLIGLVDREADAARETASLNKRQTDVAAREDAAAAKEGSLSNRQATLREDENLFDKKASLLQRALDQAMDFRRMWDSIPENQRSPAVSTAMKAAEGLMSEDLPPGFVLPGRGGNSR